MDEGKSERIKGTEFYRTELIRAGVIKQVPGFTYVIVGNEPFLGRGKEPVLKDVVLDGKKTDVYYFEDAARLYLHIKE